DSRRLTASATASALRIGTSPPPIGFRIDSDWSIRNTKQVGFARLISAAYVTGAVSAPAWAILIPRWVGMAAVHRRPRRTETTWSAAVRRAAGRWLQTPLGARPAAPTCARPSSSSSRARSRRRRGALAVPLDGRTPTLIGPANVVFPSDRAGHVWLGTSATATEVEVATGLVTESIGVPARAAAAGALVVDGPRGADLYDRAGRLRE